MVCCDSLLYFLVPCFSQFPFQVFAFYLRLDLRLWVSACSDHISWNSLNKITAPARPTTSGSLPLHLFNNTTPVLQFLGLEQHHSHPLPRTQLVLQWLMVIWTVISHNTVATPKHEYQSIRQFIIWTICICSGIDLRINAESIIDGWQSILTSNGSGTMLPWSTSGLYRTLLNSTNLY